MAQNVYDDAVTKAIVTLLTHKMAVEQGLTASEVHTSIREQVSESMSLGDVAVRLDWLVLVDSLKKTMYDTVAYYSINLGQKGMVPSVLDLDASMYCGIA